MSLQNQKRINFVRFYCDHTPLFYDLLRDKILEYLSCEKLLTIRRVCKSFQKLISEYTVESVFVPEEFLHPNHPMYRNGMGIMTRRNIFNLMHSIRFRMYKFRSFEGEYLREFLLNLSPKRHSQKLLGLDIEFPKDFNEKELSLLLNLRRYKSCSSLILFNYDEKRNLFEKYDFLSNLLGSEKSWKVKNLYLRGFKITPKLTEILSNDRIYDLPFAIRIKTHFNSFDDVLHGKTREDLHQFLSTIKVKIMRFVYSVSGIGTHLEGNRLESTFYSSLSRNTNIEDLAVLQEESSFPMSVSNFCEILENNPNITILYNSINIENDFENNSLVCADELAKISSTILQHTKIRLVRIYAHAKFLFSKRNTDSLIELIRSKNESIERIQNVKNLQKRGRFTKTWEEEDLAKYNEFLKGKDFHLDVQIIWRDVDLRVNNYWDHLKRFMRSVKECLERNRRVSFILRFNWFFSEDKKNAHERDIVNGLVEEYFAFSKEKD